KKRYERMNENRQDLLIETFMLFYFAYRTFTKETDRILDQHGIQRLHHRILFFVDRNPKISVHDLLSTLEVTKQALHAPMRQLIDTGYITSEPSTHDRRVQELYLTEQLVNFEKQLSHLQLGKTNYIYVQLG